MGVFQKIGNALARLMYGRNGVDQLSLAIVVGSLVLDLVSMFVAPHHLWLGNSRQNAKARHADKAHKYFTCKNCKTICRVPVGKGKIVITCPKCGAQIHART